VFIKLLAADRYRFASNFSGISELSEELFNFYNTFHTELMDFVLNKNMLHQDPFIAISINKYCLLKYYAVWTGKYLKIFRKQYGPSKCSVTVYQQT